MLISFVFLFVPATFASLSRAAASDSSVQLDAKGAVTRTENDASIHEGSALLETLFRRIEKLEQNQVSTQSTEVQNSQLSRRMERLEQELAMLKAQRSEQGVEQVQALVQREQVLEQADAALESAAAANTTSEMGHVNCGTMTNVQGMTGFRAAKAFNNFMMIAERKERNAKNADDLLKQLFSQFGRNSEDFAKNCALWCFWCFTGVAQAALPNAPTEPQDPTWGTCTSKCVVPEEEESELEQLQEKLKESNVRASQVKPNE